MDAEQRTAADPSALVELTRSECVDLLASHHLGRVAAVLDDGTPVIRLVNYVYDADSQSLIVATDPGTKFHALRHATHAVFEIDGIDEHARTGWSVILRGRTEEVTRSRDRRRVDELGLDSWASGDKSHRVRIRATKITGRRLVRPAPGATVTEPDSSEARHAS